MILWWVKMVKTVCSVRQTVFKIVFELFSSSRFYWFALCTFFLFRPSSQLSILVSFSKFWFEALTTWIFIRVRLFPINYWSLSFLLSIFAICFICLYEFCLSIFVSSRLISLFIHCSLFPIMFFFLSCEMWFWELADF